MNALADRLLVEAFLLTREETVFRLLYHRHTTRLWRLALRLTNGDQFAADDLLQDAWLRAMERLTTFRWESSLRTWLSGFVVNGYRERLRRLQTEAACAAWWPVEDTGANAAETGALRLDLAGALAALPPGYRTVLLLHDVEGFKHEEIAALLEIGVGTSKSQLSRARAAFRQGWQSDR